MPDVSVNMGVSGLSQFIASMNQAGASVKAIDAALKNNEKQLKATGNAEVYMQQKTALLQGKMREQTKIIDQTKAALKELDEKGVKATSKSYQDLQRKMLDAESALMDTQEQFRNLGTESSNAAQKTDQLATSLGGLNKKVSLQQVTQAIGSITTSMETAAKKAVELGKQIWDNITDSAAWADNTATQALIMDMSTEDYQRYKQVFDTVGDITIQEWHKMKRKVEKAIQEPTEDQNQLFALLGISTHEMHAGKYGAVAGMAKTYEDLFWEVSGELQRRVESGQMTQASANVFAEALFGRGFDELKPLIALGEEGFKQALEEQNVVTEDSVKKLAEMNDQVIKLQSDFKALQAEVLAGLAPALTKGAEVLDSLLGKLLKYLDSEEGQKALEDMGKAVEGLFTDLSKIDPETVVEGFAKVFNDIVSGLTWLSEHSGDVIGALEAIVLGWGALKLTGGALDMLKLVDGLNTLRDKGVPELQQTEPTGTGTGTTGGPSWVTTFLNNAVNGMGVKAMFDLNEFVTGLFKSALEGKTTEEKQEYALMHDFGITQEELLSGPGVSKGRKFQIELDLPEETKQLFEQTIDLTKGKDTPSSPMDALKGMTLEEQREYALMHDFGIKPIEDNEHFVVEDVDIEAILNAKEGKEQIEEQVGTVDIPVRLTFGGGGGGGSFNYTFDNGFSLLNRLGFHANGLASVPFDGYAAILHKGERVVPAREVGSSRNFSSNLYVESMYMNNGTDAAGLASAMAAEQRRTMNGFGS